jgi:hypothetical protein
MTRTYFGILSKSFVFKQICETSWRPNHVHKLNQIYVFVAVQVAYRETGGENSETISLIYRHSLISSERYKSMSR